MWESNAGRFIHRLLQLGLLLGGLFALDSEPVEEELRIQPGTVEGKWEPPLTTRVSTGICIAAAPVTALTPGMPQYGEGDKAVEARSTGKDVYWTDKRHHRHRGEVRDVRGEL